MTAVLKINPKRLPEPLLPPTRERRDIIDEMQRQIALRHRMEAINNKKWHDGMSQKVHNRKSIYTPEMDAKILRMLLEKCSYKQIADEIGVTVPAIKSRVARLRGCRGKYGKSFFYTPQQDAVIRKMREQGKSFAEIGAELGKSANAVRKRAKVIM